MSITALPGDILRLAFSFVPFIDRERTKRVCKIFKHYIEQIEGLCLANEVDQVKGILTEKEKSLLPVVKTYRDFIKIMNLKLMTTDLYAPLRQFSKNDLGNYLINALHLKNSPYAVLGSNPFLMYKSHKTIVLLFPKIVDLDRKIRVYNSLQKKFCLLTFPAVIAIFGIFVLAYKHFKITAVLLPTAIFFSVKYFPHTSIVIATCFVASGIFYMSSVICKNMEDKLRKERNEMLSP